MGFVLPEVIEGDGLVLRCWRVEDAELLGELVTASREHLRPWMPRYVSWESQRLAGGDAHYAMFTTSDEVGCCGLHHRIGNGGLEIGYWVDIRHTRRGYATTAARLLTMAAFEFAAIDRVEIHHDVANAASSGVPRALGYAFIEARDDVIEAPGEAGPLCVWRTTREQATRR